MLGVLAKALGRSGVHGKIWFQGLFLDNSRRLHAMVDKLIQNE